ncbi:MAG: LysM peptidoglycan-binding domain-containing protein [Clostridia bacterium]|nr:LysM peptidoglycan-binding domain-containing protein [Clostridia bacterium]
MIIHTVKKGDTIFSIAELYGVSPKLLALNNDITESLVVGDDLVVLFPEQTHTVRQGETLNSIASLYGITERRLYQNNYYLKGEPVIYPGQTLVISYSDKPDESIITNGYAYAFVRPDILRTSLSYLTYLSPFTYGMTYSGDLLPLNDETLINLAREYRTKLAMHISTLNENDVFDSSLATNIFNNSEARNNLINNIRITTSDKGYNAIDVDFEFIKKEDGPKYVSFVSALKNLGYPVIVAAAPKTSADQPGLLYEGHNYAELGNVADYLFVMTYEWGYTYGPPMAVAPIENVRRVIDYAVTEVNPSKILMGIPNYGYDWTLPYVRGESRATSIGNREAVDIARRNGVEIKFDNTAKSPYFNYTDSLGKVHEVWFENARSIKAKFELLINYSLAGVGYWNLMREFPQLWLLQNAYFGKN